MAEQFKSYAEWAARRDRLVKLARETTPGFGPRYFALIDAAYEGLGHACAMIFRDALVAPEPPSNRANHG
jgi:hypothetical protein